MFWKPARARATPTATDLVLMRRCIELSRQAVGEGEWPFAAMICRGDEILAETADRAASENDLARHAEMVVMSEVQRRLGRAVMRHCTLYSTVEPCVMCSWMVRMTGIKRVVFSIDSPVMGGHSGWNVLGDAGLTRKLRFYFRKPPEIIAGVLAEEAEHVWREWRPILWKLIKMRGVFGGRRPDRRGSEGASPDDGGDAGGSISVP
jgi:tRNA(adenine34) deaminase